MKKILLGILALLLSVVISEANDSWHNEDRYNTCVCVMHQDTGSQLEIWMKT